MGRTIRRVSALVTAVAASALLFGCAGADESAPEPSSDTAAAERSESPTQEPMLEENDTGCMVGQWALDVDDYGAQSTEWIVSLGVPLDHLTLSGSQTLTITHELFGIGTDMHADASVMGQPIATTTQYAGSGEWWWDGEGSPTITITDWAYTVDPPWTDPAAPAPPPLFDPAGGEPIITDCDGDSLSLRGADAPLTGNFTRIG